MAVILTEQTIDGFSYNNSAGAYLKVLTPSPCVLEIDKEYTVKWHETEYICTSFLTNINGYEMVAIGNRAVATGENTGEPFAIAYNSSTDYMNFFALTPETSHIIAISLNEETSGVSIVLYNRNSEAETYDGIESLTFDTPDKEKGAMFTYGVAVDNAEYEPNFSEGNQKVSLEKGQLLKEFAIKKPDTLTPANVRKNTSISGVTGTLAYIEEIETEEAMNALLTADNIGNAYRFIGESTENYVNGDLYVVEDNS